MNGTSERTAIIKGEFVTNGEKFVFRLADTPLSAVGGSAQEAFANLLKAEAAAGSLSSQIRLLAREQKGENARATVVRMTMAGLIAMAIVGGALVTAAGMAPRIASEATTALLVRINSWIDTLTPGRQEKLISLLQRVRAAVHDDEQTCPRSDKPASERR